MIADKVSSVSSELRERFKSVKFKVKSKSKEISLSRNSLTPRSVPTRQLNQNYAFNSPFPVHKNRGQKESEKNQKKSDGERRGLSFSFLKSKKFQFLLLPILVILFLGSYGYYWYFYSIGSLFTTTIKYKYLNISQTKIVSATPDGVASGIKSVKLPAEDSISAFANTTGERPTGDKSKGSVSIFNPTTEIKVIKAGSILTCTSNACKSLTYTTDADLNLGPGGSDEVAVTAGDIGENYNLAAGAGRFQVAKYNPATEVLASNVKLITGGTQKKTVKTVKAEDIKKAEDQALSQLKDKLIDRIKSDPANLNSFIIAETSIVVEKVSSDPDLKEGVDGDIVNVTVKAKGTVDAFAKDQIDVVLAKLKDEIKPQGYYLDDKFTNFSSKIAGQSQDKIDVAVTLNTIARPNIDIDAIKKNLGGKSYSDADKILASIPNTLSYTKTYEPQSLPQFFWKIPKSPARVQVKLLAEQS